MLTTLAIIGGLGVSAVILVVIGLVVFVGVWLARPVIGEPTAKQRWKDGPGKRGQDDHSWTLDQ